MFKLKQIVDFNEKQIYKSYANFVIKLYRHQRGDN